MRKVNVLEFVSLDGVIQAPGEPEEDTNDGFAYGGWTSPHSDPVSSTANKKADEHAFGLLLGRKTFDIWSRFWPQHGDVWPAVNTATKYVASNTRTSHEWQPSVFLNGDIRKNHHNQATGRAGFARLMEAQISFRCSSSMIWVSPEPTLEISTIPLALHTQPGLPQRPTPAFACF